MRAAADQDRTRAPALQGACGRAAHLTRADDHDRAFTEVAEDFSCEIDGNGTDGSGTACDGSAGTNVLGCGESFLEKTVEDNARRPGLLGDLVGVLNLTENLRLPQYH